MESAACTCILFAMRYPELPEPWEEVQDHLPIDDQNALEAVVGCKLTYDDMTDDDVSRDGEGTYPRSRRSYYVMGHRWIRIRNTETGDEYVIRLQSKMPDSKELYVSAVIAPFQNGSEITGSTMRRLPVAAIAAVYSAREIQGTININRTFAMDEQIKTFDPLKPLEPGRLADDMFLAKVGLQYDALSEANPDENTAKVMSELDETPLSSVQAWLAAARKRGFLAPVPRGGRGRH